MNIFILKVSKVLYWYTSPYLYIQQYLYFCVTGKHKLVFRRRVLIPVLTYECISGFLLPFNVLLCFVSQCNFKRTVSCWPTRRENTFFPMVRIITIKVFLSVLSVPLTVHSVSSEFILSAALFCNLENCVSSFSRICLKTAKSSPSYRLSCRPLR